MSGWTPHYIESGVHAGYTPVCLGPAYVAARSRAAAGARCDRVRRPRHPARHRRDHLVAQLRRDVMFPFVRRNWMGSWPRRWTRRRCTRPAGAGNRGPLRQPRVVAAGSRRVCHPTPAAARLVADEVMRLMDRTRSVRPQAAAGADLGGGVRSRRAARPRLRRRAAGAGRVARRRHRYPHLLVGQRPGAAALFGHSTQGDLRGCLAVITTRRSGRSGRPTATGRSPVDGRCLRQRCCSAAMSWLNSTRPAPPACARRWWSGLENHRCRPGTGTR